MGVGVPWRGGGPLEFHWSLGSEARFLPSQHSLKSECLCWLAKLSRDLRFYFIEYFLRQLHFKFLQPEKVLRKLTSHPLCLGTGP